MSGRGSEQCRSCSYWQSYPLADQTGVCDNPQSRYYNRGVSESDEACEYFSLASAGQRRCEECNDWYPLDVQPHVGECRNPASPDYMKPVFWDRISGACFEERSLVGAEFVWCGTCRQTVHASELDRHTTHRLFAGSSQFPVEDMPKFTLAGD
ncbi:MAG: hypothetical protein LYZ69_00910 [Nitrososphaerales archaeon]|nr:hypothetical protein [Nitrososphaerales archaeon]